jgi:hypothetical protein
MKLKLTARPHLLAAIIMSTWASVHAADMVATADSTSASSPAMAPGAADADAWQFGVTLPLWAPEINGNVTLRGRQMDANVNYSELKDHLDASFALALSAQKGKFGLFGNVGYMKFDGGMGDAIGGHSDWMLKFLVANAGMSYQLVKTESEHPFFLAATAGVRFWYTSTDLEHHDFNGKRDFHGYDNMNLFDPVLGLRASQYFTKKLHLDVAGDGGGFNLSHDTDWTWSASAMLTYDFAKWFSLSAGYQALAVDESTGSGKSEKGLNLIFSGAAAAATFKF